MRWIVILIILFLFSLVSGYCQEISKSDSLLTQYKEWYDSGKINEEEYKDLKSKVLFPSEVEVKSDSKTLEDYQNERKKVKKVFIPASVFTATGIALIAGGVKFKNTPPELDPNDSPSQVEQTLEAHKRQGNTLIASGVIMTTVGAAMFITGAIKFQTITEKEKELLGQLYLTPNGVLFSLKF